MSYHWRQSKPGTKKKSNTPGFEKNFRERCVEDDGVSPEESPIDCWSKVLEESSWKAAEKSSRRAAEKSSWRAAEKSSCQAQEESSWGMPVFIYDGSELINAPPPLPQSENKQQTDSEIGVNCMGNVDKKIDTICDASNNLSTDLLSALQKNSFTDVSLKCGDYTQQAHKFILAARSPVFEAMFSTPMEESEKGVVTITDIDASVLDDLLAFIYGGQVKNMTLLKGCDLLYAAEKYQVKGLKQNCINYLRSCLVIQNAIQILQFADLYDEALKKDALNYVCDNFTALKSTEEWKTLQSQKPSLSIEVFSMVVEKYEERLQKM